MAAGAAFTDFVVDLFAPLGGVRVKRMFGGAGVYCGAVMFGLIDDDVLYLKVDEESRDAFAREGAKPFSYRGRDGATLVMSYYAMPARLYDEPEEAQSWARRALGAAQAGAEKKAMKRKMTRSRRRAPRKKR